MRVFVSGGAGYIGSVACEALLRAGHGVVVFDSLVQGHRAALPTGAALVQGDLADLASVRAAVTAQRPDAVMHFAGHTQVGESMRDPLRYLGDNAVGGLNLMRAAVEAGVRRFVLSSTSHLFGRPAKIPIDETEAFHPATPYGEAKLYLERSLGWLERIHGLRWASLRYFNAAGATEDRGEDHDPETHLIPIVLQAAQGRRPKVAIFGTDWETPDGTCVRDYVHVSDLADAHLLALLALDRGSGTYNLGNGTGFSVKQVIDAARRVTGRPIAAEPAPRRDGDVARLVADSTKIKRELGWAPRVPDLDRIVESAWRWMEKNPKGYGDQPQGR